MWWKLRNFVSGLNEILYVYRSYFLFLLLVLAAILLIETNPNQQLIFLRKRIIFISALIGEKLAGFQNVAASGPAIQRLRDQNIELAKRNIVLEDAYLENVRLRRMVAFRDRFPMETVAAGIVAREPNPELSTIILNKGAKEGLRPHQNVITVEGLVGEIREVSDHHAVCHIMLDQNFRVASSIQRTRLNGVVYWPGHPNEVAFYGVLKNLDVRIGDVVLTSDLSEYFLPNIRVGVVTAVNNEVEGIFKDIRLKPFVDFDTLEEVFVITDSVRTKARQTGFEKFFQVDDR